MVEKRKNLNSPKDGNRDDAITGDVPPEDKVEVNASSLEDGGETAKNLGEAFDDNVCFNNVILKPSNIGSIWLTFKVKKSMFDYMQWYFRPRNSYEPERVDYNALNILAEY